MALDGVVEEWIDEYEKSNEDGMMKLINFLLRCCGCTQLLSADDFSNDDIVETLEEVLLRYKEVRDAHKWVCFDIHRMRIPDSVFYCYCCCKS